MITDAPINHQVSLDINSLVLEDSKQGFQEKKDNQKTDNPEQFDLEEILGSPFSDDPMSPKTLSSTESEGSEDDSRCKRNLIRSKKRSFVFSDSSSEEECEDVITIEDIEAIDDGIVEEDVDFSYSSLHHKLAEKDEQKFYRKLKNKMPSLKVMKSAALSSSTVDSDESFQTNPASENAKREKKRQARKRLRTWKINKKRKDTAKRSKILFL